MTRPQQPDFILFPLHNARTAYQPVALPVVLIVPWVRNKDGFIVESSDVFDVGFKIEDAPGKVPVSGFEHRGIFVPDTERFVRDVELNELTRYLIDLSNYTILDSVTKAEKEYEDIVDGDIVVITLASGIRDELIFYADANYYDLSTISIETHDLAPIGKNYIFSWHASYYRRIISPNQEFNCIDVNFTGLARLPIEHAHPGDVHQSMIELSPPIYFDGARLDQDSTVKFYRPLADALQDVFDEEELLTKLNSIQEIPATYIPYLAYLLGWDLPYFPGSTDEMRRRILLNARRLQELKGSRLCIMELFESFGFIINLVNLWSTTDGKRLVAPNDALPIQYDGQEIEQKYVCRADPLISDWTNASASADQKNGFGNYTIPLLNRPFNGDITIEAWVLNTSSAVYQTLLDSAEEYTELESDICAVDTDGFLTCPAFHARLAQGSIIGYSQVLLGPRGILKDEGIGQPPLGKDGVLYDEFHNTIHINFGRYLDLKADERLFVFATYRTSKVTVPSTLLNLRTNKFDLEILVRPDGDEADPDVLKFLIDFVFRLKAFHSLLRKIAYTTDKFDVYNVGDLCVGGDIRQRPGTTIGELQTTPPIDPGEIEQIACAESDATSRFKKADITVRNTILDGLEAEFQGWKALDGTHEIPTGFEDTHNSISILPLFIPSRATCEFTEKGQDRKFAADIDLDQNPDTRDTACTTDSTNRDFCYKGRVSQEVETVRELVAEDSFRFKACNLGLGFGFYFVRDNGTLQYTNRDSLESVIVGSETIMRPSLDIQKNNLHIPGHRFPLLSNLTNDLTHPLWGARPWDDMYNPLCPNDRELADLEFHLEVDENGDEVMVFNDVPLIYFGNGLPQDISSLGEHVNTYGLHVTHKIYSTAPAGHPAITLDQTVLISGTGNEDIICFPEEYAGIFDSASE
jgi:P2-related tail formation protein